MRRKRAAKLTGDVRASRGWTAQAPRRTGTQAGDSSELTRRANRGTLCVSGPLSALLGGKTPYDAGSASLNPDVVRQSRFLACGCSASN